MCAICDAHKKKVVVELLYNSVHWKFNQLEIRRVGEKILDWGICPREPGPPGPRLSSPGKREKNTVVAIGVGVNMLQFCSVPNSLSHTTLSIKWEVYFSKELCRSSLLCRCNDYACICIWVCNTNYIQTCIPGAISVKWQKTKVFVTDLLVWKMNVTYFRSCCPEYDDTCKREKKS